MIRFQLVSLEGLEFDEDVYEVTIPTLDGEIGVLKDHMPLVSVAKTGVIAIRRQARDADSAREVYAINGGVVEVSKDHVLRVLVDDADHPDEINVAETQKALELAQKMKAEATDEVSLEQAQAMVDRHAVRLQVAGLKRNKKR